MPKAAVKKALTNQITIRVPSIHLDRLIPIVVEHLMDHYDNHQAFELGLDRANPEHLWEIRESHGMTREELNAEATEHVKRYILNECASHPQTNSTEAQLIYTQRTADAIKRHFQIPPEVVDDAVWNGNKPSLPYFGSPPPDGCPETGQVKVIAQDNTTSGLDDQKRLI